MPGTKTREQTGAGSEQRTYMSWMGRTSASNDGGSGQIRQNQKGGGQPSGNLGLETHAN
jgi:hypothetical protein